jgi:hypothetical protein
MELKGLCIPVGLITSLVAVFYCFGVFEVNELTTLSREPLRAQSAPITRVAAPPRIPAAPVPQAKREAPVAVEHTAEKNQVQAQRPLTPTVPPAPPQSQHATLALDTGPYRQQVDEPLQHEPYVDELLEQAEAAAASAQVQAQVQTQLLNSGAEFDPSTASDALEQPQQYEPVALQDDLPQQ